MVSRYNRFSDMANPLSIPVHDYISNTYDANDNLVTVEYYLGGSGGELVATLTMTYDGNGNVLTVTRT